MDMSDYDSMWYWWRRLQDEHPSAVAVRDARADSTSPHYRPTTPPSPSRSSTPVSPSTPAGRSAVGSASFDIRSLRPSSARGSPSKPEATADARTTPTLPEMQVDPQDISPEDARAIAEALAADEPAPVLRVCPSLVSFFSSSYFFL
jgi:transglutaminase-like putative cysteine protease